MSEAKTDAMYCVFTEHVYVNYDNNRGQEEGIGSRLGIYVGENKFLLKITEITDVFFSLFHFSRSVNSTHRPMLIRSLLMVSNPFHTLKPE